MTNVTPNMNNTNAAMLRDEGIRLEECEKDAISRKGKQDAYRVEFDSDFELMRPRFLFVYIVLLAFMFCGHFPSSTCKAMPIHDQSFKNAFIRLMNTTQTSTETATTEVTWYSSMQEPYYLLFIVYIVLQSRSITYHFKDKGAEVDKLIMQFLWFVQMCLIWVASCIYNIKIYELSVYMEWSAWVLAGLIFLLRMYLYACYPGKCDIIPYRSHWEPKIL